MAAFLTQISDVVCQQVTVAISMIHVQQSIQLQAALQTPRGWKAQVLRVVWLLAGNNTTLSLQVL